MSDSLVIDVAFSVFAVAAVVSGWRVFRTDSMVRASFLLLASFLNVAAIMLLLAGEYLGLALFFMMAVEMTVMALFMVGFMMNPAGLNPMQMVHQEKVAIGAGVGIALALSVVGIVADFPRRPVVTVENAIEDLGVELLGDSMLVFESAGVALLATMIGAIALSSRHGRHGAADEGSVPPPLDPDAPAGDNEAAARDSHAGHAAHAGHTDHVGHGGHGGHGAHGGHG